jgi:hypothetical protein
MTKDYFYNPSIIYSRKKNNKKKGADKNKYFIYQKGCYIFPSVIYYIYRNKIKIKGGNKNGKRIIGRNGGSNKKL